MNGRVGNPRSIELFSFLTTPVLDWEGYRHPVGRLNPPCCQSLPIEHNRVFRTALRGSMHSFTVTESDAHSSSGDQCVPGLLSVPGFGTHPTSFVIYLSHSLPPSSIHSQSPFADSIVPFPLSNQVNHSYTLVNDHISSPLLLFRHKLKQLLCFCFHFTSYFLFYE